MDKRQLLGQLEAARAKYLPEKIKAVIIAEAPPDSIDRFFYYEDVNKADYLFLGIIGVLYPGAKDIYLKNVRNPEMKELLLKQFQSDGYYLLDLFELPISMNSETDSFAVMKLSSKIEKLKIQNIPIILIKANVYDIAYHKLKLKFNVINKRIDFPSTGNQVKFHEKFLEVISQIK
jgi:hypothetical protein